jgi:hypothetical protein
MSCGVPARTTIRSPSSTTVYDQREQARKLHLEKLVDILHEKVNDVLRPSVTTESATWPLN